MFVMGPQYVLPPYISQQRASADAYGDTPFKGIISVGLWEKFQLFAQAYSGAATILVKKIRKTII